MLDYLRQSNNQQLAKLISTKTDGVNIGPKIIELADFISSLNKQSILSLEGESVDNVNSRFNNFVDSYNKQ